MRNRTTLYWLLLAVIVLLQCLVIAVAALNLEGASQSQEGMGRLRQYFTLWILLVAGLQAACFYLLYRLIIKPLRMLTKEVDAINKVSTGSVIDMPSSPLLSDVVFAFSSLANALLEARRNTISSVSAGAQQLQEHEGRLAAILRELKDGIVVCDEMGRILLFNSAAEKIFRNSDALRVHHSLYVLCARQPIENALELLRKEAARGEPEGKTDHLTFRCSALDGSIQLSCSLNLLPPAGGQEWSFVLFFQDVTATMDQTLRQQLAFLSRVETMRSPLANLRVSAEGLALCKDASPEVRSELEGIILDEADRLSASFHEVTRQADVIRNSLWSREDILSSDLLHCVANRLLQMGITVTFTGHPIWVNVDGHSMIELMAFVVHRISEHCKSAELEVETLLSDRRVYFAFLWKGSPLPESVLAGWHKEQLVPYPSPLSVADVLQQHDSEMWSKTHSRGGYAMLVLPAPFSIQKSRPQTMPPSRPVFTSPATYCAPPLSEEAASRRLSECTFVAFDTETTGLLPSGGDEIVAVGGVVMTGSRIFMGDVFHSLVNPGRLIPARATKIHGISNEMVSGQPPADQVLKAFHTFIGESVLVGYDIAFDLSFIQAREPIENPVLDLLLLSMAIYSHSPEHSLEAIAWRVGVDPGKRTAALSDAFIIGQIFLRFLPRLNKMGIVTLGQAYKVSSEALNTFWGV